MTDCITDIFGNTKRGRLASALVALVLVARRLFACNGKGVDLHHVVAAGGLLADGNPVVGSSRIGHLEHNVVGSINLRRVPFEMPTKAINIKRTSAQKISATRGAARVERPARGAPTYINSCGRKEPACAFI